MIIKVPGDMKVRSYYL